MRRAITIAVAIAVGAYAASTTPALTYRVHKKALDRSHEYLVFSSDTRVRADSPTSLPMFDALLTDGGSPIALNSELQTWFALDDHATLGMESRYLSGLPNAKPRKLEWHLSDAVITPDGTRSYTGTLHYTMRASSGRGSRDSIIIDYDAKIAIETDAKIDRSAWIGRILPTTTIDEIDAQLARSDAKIEGLPRKLTMTTTRTYKGGAPMTDTMTVIVSDIHETTVDPAIFTRPAAYRNQKPILASPGVFTQARMLR
ncbi:MAG TPA: hypothetical protein VF787_04045 [Thermoanaerobaculia bacterium]